MSPKSIKATLRSEALAARDQLSLEWRAEASRSIDRFGSRQIEVSDGQIVSGFFPIRSEVDIRPLMESLARKGARLCLPVVLDKQTLEFREFTQGAELVETGFGTKGPGSAAAIIEPHLMLVPLAAFDARGHRIGYGAGYYDRAIAGLRSVGRPPRLIGVGFDAQQVDHVPDHRHDIALPLILTESGLRQMSGDRG